MKLKLKQEFIEYSISCKGERIYFGDIKEEDYEKYYKMGYTKFFQEVKIKEKEIIIEKINKEEDNDTN